MMLYDLAHSRAGDKGNISTISVIAYDRKDYDLLAGELTAEQVKQKFAPLGVQRVKRFELPAQGALHFVLVGSPGSGVTHTLALDAHGKSLSGFMLEIEISGPGGKEQVNRDSPFEARRRSHAL